MAVVVLGLRTRWSPVVRAVRRFNRAVVNPRALRSAGSPGARASVLRHRGRTSGRAYETPVGLLPTYDGFVIALPYGPGADWVRNVLAQGSATVVHEGRTLAVERPEVVPVDRVREWLSASDQRTLAVFGVRELLRLRLAEPAATGPGAPDAGGR